MYIHPDDRSADPLTQRLGTLANRAADHYQRGQYVAAGFALGELHAYVFENFTRAWSLGLVDWITEALEFVERAPANDHSQNTLPAVLLLRASIDASIDGDHQRAAELLDELDEVGGRR